MNVCCLLMQLSESDSDVSSAHASSTSSHSQQRLQVHPAGVGAHPAGVAAHPQPAGAQQQVRFQECVEEGSRVMKRGDFPRAVQMYSEALELDPHNHLIFSNRSVAYIKMRQFELALQDARRAKALKPGWYKVSGGLVIVYVKAALTRQAI